MGNASSKYPLWIRLAGATQTEGNLDQDITRSLSCEFDVLSASRDDMAMGDFDSGVKDSVLIQYSD